MSRQRGTTETKGGNETQRFGKQIVKIPPVGSEESAAVQPKDGSRENGTIGSSLLSRTPPRPKRRAETD